MGHCVPCGGPDLNRLCRLLSGKFDHSIFEYDASNDTLTFIVAPDSAREKRFVYNHYLRGAACPDCIQPESRKALESAVLFALRRPITGRVELMADFDGCGAYWYRVSYMSEGVPGGRASRVFGRLAGIQQEKEQDLRRQRREEDLRKKADYDAVTRVLNRSATEERINASLAEGGPASVLAIIDVDNFKCLNDSFGHPFGDMILRRITETIAGSCRKSDIFGRIGGDEFAIFLLHVGSADYAEKKLCGILESVSELSCSLGPDVCTSISMGAAVTLPEDSDFSQVFRRADSALYLAKQRGKRRLVMYTPEAD